MKKIKNVFRLFVIYLATNCFRKLLEEKEIDPLTLKEIVKGNEVLFQSVIDDKRYNDKSKNEPHFISGSSNLSWIFETVEGDNEIRLKKFLLGKNMYLYIVQTKRKFVKGENVFFKTTMKWYDVK